MSISPKLNSFWLYRPLLNWQDIYLWAIEAKLEEIIHHRHFHVTVASTMTHVDWSLLGGLQTNELEIAADTDIQHIGRLVKCIPLKSPALSRRFNAIKKIFPMEREFYSPHLTLYRRGRYFPERVPRYTGRIILGPEVLKPNFIDLPKSNVTVNRNHWRTQLGLAEQDDVKLAAKLNLNLKNRKKSARHERSRDHLSAVLDDLSEHIRKKIKVE